MSTAVNIALAGLGEIATQQHLPAIASSQQWQLAATISRSSSVPGVPNYVDMPGFLHARPDVSVVSLCAPPGPRFAMAEAALLAGRHVMLEKPPGATVTECRVLASLAARTGRSLFATWHSREAAAVDTSRDWLRGRRVRSFGIVWKEDVRRWHPGQEWIWQQGGFGVFDPGINALSILTRLLDETPRVRECRLQIPANRQTPIAAQFRLQTAGGATGEVSLDWRHRDADLWEIVVQTDEGELRLLEGGAVCAIHGEGLAPTRLAPTLNDEYPRLYRRMAELVDAGTSDCDFAPLEIVTDACMIAKRELVEPFHF